MTSNFPNGPDSIVNNVGNTTPEFDIHPPLHNQLADAIMAVEVSLLAGGSLSLGDHLASADPHPVYLTQPEGDARYAPISGGGYLTQVQADARYLQLAGGTLSGNLLFSADNLRDIGAVAANRPRTLFLGTSLVTPGWTNATNLLANTDNTVDIGASAASRPRTIYVGTSMVSPGWTNGTNFLANTDNTRDIGASGANRPRNVYAGGFLNLGTTSAIGPLNPGDLMVARSATTGIIFFGNSPAANIYYDGTQFIATIGGGIWEQRSGGSPQTLRIYNTYTDASNYERLVLVGRGGSGLGVTTEKAGTGTNTSLSVWAGPGGPLYLGGGGTTQWSISASGLLYCTPDNTYDIGISGNRPRNVFVAGAVATGVKAGSPVDADVNTPTDGMIRIDSTNNRAYFRVGGVWRYAALT